MRRRRARRTLRLLPQLSLLAAGTAGGLAWSLPVHLASGFACPASGEGRAYCQLQHAWAPALTRLTLCMAAAWLLGEWLFVRLPELRSGRRRPRVATPRADAREVLLGDETLRAATWGILPPPSRPSAAPVVTVASIMGGAEVIPLRPYQLQRAAALRVSQGRRPGRDPSDPALVAACWSVVSRASMRLVDAAAVQLGLATEAPAPVAASPAPEPLLLAASWGRGTAPATAPAAPVRELRPRGGRARAWWRRRRARLVPRTGRERFAIWSTRLGALAFGLWWALPLRDAHGVCPPSGEGFGMCSVQKSVLPGVLEVTLVVVTARLLVHLWFRVLPPLRARWQAGERPTRMTEAQAAAPFEDDPVLLAASWGVRTDQKRTGTDG